MTDDTRRPDNESEFDEPVFSSEEEESTDSESEASTDLAPDSTVLPAPEPPVEPVAKSPSVSELEVPGIDEPVFASSGEPDESHGPAQVPELPETVYEPPELEFSTSAPVFGELEPEESFEGKTNEQDYDPQDTTAAGTDWVNIAPASETTDDLRLETEYNFFDDTPAAEVADAPPPTRKLGRTGPVWVLGGIALVLIAGLVWLGITRLTGSTDTSTEASSEPSVQQVAAEEPTPAPPTNTPGPEPTPTPILLPVNATVIVGATDGHGVNLRIEPGETSEVVEVIAEGIRMVVLGADPDLDYPDYPVLKDGYLWYRMRATGMTDREGKPLVGWSASEFFVVDDQ